MYVPVDEHVAGSDAYRNNEGGPLQSVICVTLVALQG